MSGVALVVLSWNDGERVAGLLEQVRALEPGPERVIVVDNGSSPDSRRHLAGSGAEMIELPENLGFAAAANRGIEAALAGGANWVWLLNGDTTLPRDALSALLQTAEADARNGMVAAVLLDEDGAVQARGGRVSLWTGIARHVVEGGEGCDYLSGACLLLRAAMLREIGLFDEGYFFYWEDVDLSWRAREAGWKLAVADDCRIVHTEAGSLGRWSSERWFHLFAGMGRFLRARAPAPRLAIALRFVWHAATMLRHGRAQALRGAWRGCARESATGAHFRKAGTGAHLRE